MTTVTMFKAVDGQIFDTKEKCAEHEIDLEVQDFSQYIPEIDAQLRRCATLAVRFKEQLSMAFAKQDVMLWYDSVDDDLFVNVKTPDGIDYATRVPLTKPENRDMAADKRCLEAALIGMLMGMEVRHHAQILSERKVQKGKEYKQ